MILLDIFKKQTEIVLWFGIKKLNLTFKDLHKIGVKSNSNKK